MKHQGMMNRVLSVVLVLSMVAGSFLQYSETAQAGEINDNPVVNQNIDENNIDQSNGIEEPECEHEFLSGVCTKCSAIQEEPENDENPGESENLAESETPGESESKEETTTDGNSDNSVCQHEFVDGVCSKCSATEEKPECEHEFVDGVCSKCNATELKQEEYGQPGDNTATPDTSACEHNNLTYISNEDGTHQVVCADCQAVITEEEECDIDLEEDDTICDKCGAAFDLSALENSAADVAAYSSSDNELLINGEPFGEITVHYGDKVEFSVKGINKNLSFYYLETNLDPEVDEWHNIDDAVDENGYLKLEPGNSYFIGYSNAADVISFTNQYSIEVLQSKVGDATELSWGENDSFVLSWYNPVVSKYNGYLSHADWKTSYILTLYKDGNVIKTYNDINRRESDAEKNSFQLKDYITGNEGGYGTYKYTIQALSNNSTYYADGDPVESSEYVYKDKVAPIIVSYKKSDSKENSLEGTIKDNETGVAAYAFSTEQEADRVIWTSVDAGDVEKSKELTFTYDLTQKDGGKYYLYVKDTEGNITRSEESICFTKVIKKNLFQNGVLQEDLVSYHIGSSDISIPDPNRYGFSFSAWHIGNIEGETIAFTDKKLTSSDSHFATTLELYAGWSTADISVSVSPSNDINKVYDNTSVTLDATVSSSHLAEISKDEKVSIQYQWLAKTANSTSDEYIAVGEPSSSSSLSVKNVNQSGDYKVRAIVTIGGEEPIAEESNPVTIKITKKDLEMSVKEYYQISYGDSLDDKVLSIKDCDLNGLCEGDEESVSATGNITSTEYAVGSNAGTKYAVSPAGFTSENYNISYTTKKTLQVNRYNVNADESEFAGTLSATEYVYSGNENRPEVSITRNGELFENADDETKYNVTYEDNISAGTGYVKVTFVGNYSGEIKLPFTIKRDSFSIQATIGGTNHSWTYAKYDAEQTDEANSDDNAPVIVVLNDKTLVSGSYTDSDVVYLTRKATGENAYSEWEADTIENIANYDAGVYQFKVKIKQTGNYEVTESEPIDFTIKPRVIALQSESYIWTYDSNIHTLPEVTILPSGSAITVADGPYIVDGFAGSDNFKSVKTTATITAVGSVPNTIAYDFTSTTIPSNYCVIKQEGTLTVNRALLAPPTNVAWDSTTPGLVSWVPVSRKELTVSYKVALYDNLNNLINVTEEGYFLTDNPYFDFGTIIREQAAQKLGGYHVKVIAVPSGGNNQGNYVESALSAPSGNIYTAKVSIDKVANGVSSAIFEEEGDTKSTEKIMIAGEQAEIEAIYEAGYVKPIENVWVTQSISGSDTSAIAISDKNSTQTTVTVLDSLRNPWEYKIVAQSKDEDPYITWSFSKYYEETYNNSADAKQKVCIDVDMCDSLKLSSYIIKKFDHEATENELADLVGGDDWTQIEDTEKTKEDSSEQFAISQYEIGLNEEQGAGYYYFGVKDSNNQVAWTEPCIVYEIKLQSGTGTGEDFSILKVHDYAIEQLPKVAEDCGFIKQGYAFTEWEENTSKKIFSKEGLYSDNASSVLVAKWSNEPYKYTIQYYYMGTDGSYASEPSEAVEFEALIGTEISPDSALIAKEKLGFERDSSGEHNTGTIVIDAPDKAFSVYYARKKYTLSYSYKYTDKADTDEGAVVSGSSIQYYYDQEITGEEEQKPEIEGYTFNGWTYDGTGSRPGRMPAHDVTAYGELVPNDTKFFIHYYVCDTDKNGYTEMASLAVEKKTPYGTSILFDLDENGEYAKTIEGCSLAKVETVNGVAVPVYNSVAEGTKTGTVLSGDQALHVYYFYNRNTYKVALNIWKGTRDNEDNKIYDAYREFQYGENIGEFAQRLETYYQTCVLQGNQDASITEVSKKNVDLTGYVPAPYQDWSTAARPETMPAGNVTLTLDYIYDTEQEFHLEIYLDAGNGTYTKVGKTLNYFAPAGCHIYVQQDNKTAPEDAFRVITVDSLKSYVGNIAYYELAETPKGDSEANKPVLDGFVTKSTTSGEEPLVLKVYLNRKKFKTTIYYFYNTTSSKAADAFATQVCEGEWGTTVKLPDNQGGAVYDPLLHFDDKIGTSELTYRTGGCVVSYSARYYLDGYNYYPSYRFTTEDSVTDAKRTEYQTAGKVLFGQNDEGYIYVRYMPASVAHFGIDVKYRPYPNGTNQDVTCEYNLDGDESGTQEECRFKIINKSQVYTPILNGTESTIYPGLFTQGIKGTVTGYETSTINGFVEINDFATAIGVTNNNTYHYFKNTNHTDNIIYIVSDTYPEELHPGFLYGGNIDGSVPYHLVEKIRDAYNQEHAGATIHIYNTSYSGYGTAVDNPDDGVLVYTFAADATYAIFHNVNGNQCDGHYYSQGTVLTEDDLENISCNVVTAAQNERVGYTIGFRYDDSVTMNQNHVYEGTFQKKVLDYSKYYYYELADEIDGCSYITEKMITVDASGTSATATCNNQTVDLSVTSTTYQDYAVSDSANKPEKVTEFRYGDKVVLRREDYKGETFQPISILYDSEPHKLPGYHFDATQDANNINGYLEAIRLDLRAYYALDRFSMIVDTNKGDNNVTYQYKNSQNISIPKPTRDGYTFAGWNFYEGNTPGEEKKFEVATTDSTDRKSSVFAMPAKDTYMQAQWKKCNVPIKIKHYFQTNAGGYSEQLLEEALKALEAGNTGSVSVRIGNSAEAKSGTVYYKDESKNEILCVSMQEDGREAFYLVESVSSDEIIVSEADLFAITEEKEKEVESTVTFAELKVEKGHFEYASAKASTTQKTINASDSVTEFAVEYGMQMTYYYTRTGEYKIEVKVVADQTSVEGSPNAKIAISGNQPAKFGDTITVSQTIAEGYVFKGWYSSDILDENGNLIAGWNGRNDLLLASAERAYSARMYADCTVVAVYKSKIIQTSIDEQQSMTIGLSSDQTEYTYGYTNPKNIRAKVEFPAGTDPEVYVENYEWYRIDEAGEVLNNLNVSVADYPFPENMSGGTYRYICKANLARKDNKEVAQLISEPITITVKKVDFYVKADPVSTVYDGQNHSVEVDLDKTEYPYLASLTVGNDYQIYYAETEITTENLNEASKTPIDKKDVCATWDESGKKYVTKPYTIYYYVAPIGDAENNYNPVSGSTTLTIHPKQLKISSDKPFTKQFDDQTLVAGSVTEEGTDKYRLSFGGNGDKYYRLDGWINESDANSKTLDFKAEFNDKHVNNASSVTLSDLKIVNHDGTVDTNYCFVSGKKLTISGYITQLPLHIVWSETEGGQATDEKVISYSYDGESHLPSASFGNLQLPDSLSGKLDITESGAATNVGSDYKASASLVANDAEIDTGDYQLIGGEKAFAINGYEISIQVKPDSRVYNASPQEMTDFYVDEMSEDNSVKSGTKILKGGKEYTLYMAAVSKNDATGFIDCGTYTFTPDKVKVTDSNNKDVTDNFTIQKKDGDLTIIQKGIRVSGIKAQDKVYDGNVQATLSFTGPITFDGLCGTDQLELNTEKITGEFESSAVGTHTVHIFIGKDALRDAGTQEGSTSKNYALILDEGEPYQSATTQATITNAALQILPKTSTAVFGDPIKFQATGMIGEKEVNISEEDFWGEITYTVIDGTETKTITRTIDQSAPIKGSELISPASGVSLGNVLINAGKHVYSIDVSNLHTGNYNCSNNEQAADLIISPREITANVLTGEAGQSVTKVYDGTMTVDDTTIKEIISSQSSYFTIQNAVEGAPVKVKGITAIFDKKDATTNNGATKVILSNIQLDNENYIWKSGEKIEINASITPRPITIGVGKRGGVYGATITKEYGTPWNNATTDDVVSDCGVKLKTVASEGTFGTLGEGDILESIISEVSYGSTYDDTQTDKRNVGEYDITVNSYTASGNYTVTTESCKLKITPVKIKVSVSENKNVTGFPSASESGDTCISYGSQLYKKWYSPEFEGNFKYGEHITNVESIPLYISYTDESNRACTLVLNDDVEGIRSIPPYAGVFRIYPELSAIQVSDDKTCNYTFVDASITNVKVTLKPISLSGNFISVSDKVYDATTDVGAEQLCIGENIKFTISEDGKWAVREGAGEASFNYEYIKKTTESGSQIEAVDIDYLTSKHATGIKFYLTTENSQSTGTVKKTSYNSKDVATANTVTLVYELDDYMAKRYQIAEGRQTEASADITRKNLVIKAQVDPATVQYGAPMPTFSNNYDSFAVQSDGTSETIEVLSVSDNEEENNKPSDDGYIYSDDTKQEKWATLYKSSETEFSQVGSEYTVVPYGFKIGENGNYNVSYENTQLVVKKATLAAPTVKWVEGKPGVVGFESTPAIGSVTVDHYEMELYKGDTKIELTNSDSVDYSKVDPGVNYDLLETIRSNGPGKYVVKVKAFAITTEGINKDHFNVDDSEWGESAPTYAANVILQMDTGNSDTSAAVKQAIVNSDDSNCIELGHIDLANNSLVEVSAEVTEVSRVVVSGETDKGFCYVATGTNATGYKVADINTSTVVSVTRPESFGIIADDTPVKTYKYQGKYSVGMLTNADDIPLKICLEKNKAEVSGALQITKYCDSSVGINQDKLPYGYSNTSATTFQYTVNVKEGDTITTEDYSYTYKWYVKKSGPGTANIIEDSQFLSNNGNRSTLTFPTKADNIGNIGSAGDYTVWCVAIATRKDNQEQSAEIGSNKEGAKVTVSYGKLSGKTISFSETNAWEYGSQRKTVEISNEPADYTGEPVLYYSTENKDTDTSLWSDSSHPNTWQSNMITDACEEGENWYATAYLPKDANYEQYVLTPVSYRITPATLGQVSGITLNLANSEGHQYGDITWSPASTIYENAGTQVGADCDSRVVPHYQVKVSYSATEGGSYFELKSYATGVSCGCNIAEALESNRYEKGYYKVSVTAVPDASDTDQGARDRRNAKAGTAVEVVFPIGEIAVNVDRIERTYDNTDTVLTAVFVNGTPDEGSVRWYKDDASTPIVAENGSAYTGTTYNVRNVDQSGTYYCVATIGGKNYVTTKTQVTIKPREVKFTGESGELMYTGLEQSITGIASETASGDDTSSPRGLVSGHALSENSLTYKTSGTQVKIENGVVAAYPGEFTIAEGGIRIVNQDSKDVTSNYTIETVIGSLKITPSTAPWNITMVDATPVTYDGQAHGNPNAATTEALGVTTFTYSFEENGTYTSELSGLTKVDAGTYTIYVKATNPNYATVATTTSKIVINKKPVELSWKLDGNSVDQVTYTGTEHVMTAEVSNKALPTDDVDVATYENSGSNVNKATHANAYYSDADNYAVYTAKALTLAGTSAHNYTLVDGTTISKEWKIVPKALELKGQSDTRTYTGTEIELTGITPEGIVSGHQVHGLSYSAKGITIGEYDGAFTVDATGIRIVDGADQDVTKNYSITQTAGKLTIQASSSAWSVSMVDATPVTYDGQAHGNANVATTGVLGDTTFTYSFEENGTYISELSGLTKVDAGTYTIYVKATNPNYATEAKTTSKIVIKKKPVELSWKLDGNDVDQITYTGTEHVMLATVNNKALSTDEVVVATYENSGSNVNKATHANAYYSDADNYAVYTAKALALTGASADNYTLVGGMNLSKGWSITPRSIDSLALSGKTDNSLEFSFDGTEKTPSIVVKVLVAEGEVKVLTKDVDYKVIISDLYKPTATYPGEYTVKVEGIGNYTGTLTQKYSIVDSASPVITGGTEDKTITDNLENNIFCVTPPTITVSDPTLKTVEITSGTDIVKTYTLNPETTTDKVDGNVVQTIPASDLVGTDEGKVYKIVATDMSGNQKTVEVKVYQNHAFTNYVPDTDTEKQPNGFVYDALCDHDCGAHGYIVKPAGEITWNYHYQYASAEGIEEGTQNKAERETNAVVELYQNNQLIACKLVSCSDVCGDVENAQESATKAYEFATYNASDVTADGTDVLPYADGQGVPYTYSMQTFPVRLTGNGYEKITNNTYAVDSGVVHFEGDRANITYTPGCFDVPWKVTLSDLPYDIDENGNKVYRNPDKLYVKILYATSGNAADQDYQIITQQTGNEALGVSCDAVRDGDGTYSYSGAYPCWKVIGGTTDSYYHRIVVTGFMYDNRYYDVSGRKLRSICDEDHEKHTIAYDADTDGATGTIEYEIKGLLPVLVFDKNDGENTKYAVLWAGLTDTGKGGVITTEKMSAVPDPTREGYTFEGWFDATVGGTRITEDVDLADGSRTIYAHWTKLPDPEEPEEPDEPDEPDTPDGPDTPDEPDEPKEPDNPDTPDEPDEPEEPDTPDEPDEPDEPDTPSTPGEPDEPEEPNEPVAPDPDDPVISDPDKPVIPDSDEPVTPDPDKPVIPDSDKPVTPDPEIPETKPDGEIEENPSDDEPNVITEPENTRPIDREEMISSEPENAKTADQKEAKPAEQDKVQPAETENKAPAESQEVKPEESSKDIPAGAGKIKVIVENPIPEEEMEQEDYGSNDIIGDLPDTEKVAQIVLTPEEMKIIEEGGEVIIRLTVDDNRKDEPHKEEKPGLYRLMDNLDKEAGEKAVFKSFISLRLEKKVNDGDWENLMKSGEPIKVVIEIPEGYVLGAKRVYLAKEDGSEFILLEDMDDDPATITFMTDDFTCDYAFFTIEDEEVALGTLEPDRDCFWHWYIVLTAVLYLVVLLITMKKKEEQETDTESNDGIVAGTDGTALNEQEELKKLAKKSCRNRWGFIVVYLIAIAIFTYLGECNKDLPLAIVATILVGGTDYGTYKHKW